MVLNSSAVPAAEVDAIKDGNGLFAPAETKATLGPAEPRHRVVPFDDPAYFINRELSSLAFQRRVLAEAQDLRNPVLERVKFLSIVSSNLDEFFMVRVAGLQQQIAARVVDRPADGLTPAEQMAAVRKSALDLMIDMRATFTDILPVLRRHGVHLLDYNGLNEKRRSAIQSYFEEVVFPVLTPLAVDPGRPFPHISNLSLNLAVLVRDADGEIRFARVKVPGSLPRLLPLKRSSGGLRRDGTVPRNHYFVWLDQVIAANLQTLFPGMEVIEAHPFRVTRDADISIQELEASDLLETIEESVRRRRFGGVVCATVTPGMPKRVLDLLMREMNIDVNDVYVLEGPLGLSGLSGLYGIDRHDLKAPEFHAPTPAALDAKTRGGSIFGAIRRGDVLLHHPYDSFAPVVEFLEEAASDPAVMAIKQTLYRVGGDSPVVSALLRARQNGKQVAVLVELKARFDEESNILWARMLEDEGVHVVYGLLGLKTHSKVALVVRREGERLRRYVHLATGNYNPVTASGYTDMGLFTCDEEIGADATDLFNYLTGYSAKTSWRKLIVAPINLRSRMEELIRREIVHAESGRGGHLIFKMNALVDRGMISTLYEASCAGVQIELIIRGVCCLRPGIPGVSDNIRVVSIVGRFLEHSRAYWFRNGGDEEVYLGSADLMPRNIDRRVEVLFPVEDRELIRQLRHDVLDVYLADNVNSWSLSADGSYTPRVPTKREPPMDSQRWFLDNRDTSVLETKSERSTR